MADANRGSRPLSPHLSIYRLPLAAQMSIMHRMTGCGLALTALLVVWWFLAAASSPHAFAIVDGLLTSWVGWLVLLVSLVALWYHFFSGLRHLVWDTGAGFPLDQVKRSGIAVLVAAGVMTIVVLVVALV